MINPKLCQVLLEWGTDPDPDGMWLLSWDHSEQLASSSSLEDRAVAGQVAAIHVSHFRAVDGPVVFVSSR